MKLLFAITICLLVSYRAYSEEESFLMKSQKFDPIREHSVVVTNEGYFPQRISLFVGETLRVFLTTTEDQKGCLMMPSHKLFLAANKGRLTSGEVKFDNPGEYQYFCPNTGIKGSVVVLERKKKKILRAPAGENRAKVWMPRES